VLSFADYDSESYLQLYKGSSAREGRRRGGRVGSCAVQAFSPDSEAKAAETQGSPYELALQCVNVSPDLQELYIAADGAALSTTNEKSKRRGDSRAPSPASSHKQTLAMLRMEIACRQVRIIAHATSP
jgi:hypothetical protein